MTATFILVALSYGGIRSELAVLKEERADAPDPAADNAEVAKQISEMQAAVTQAMSDMKTGLSAEIGKIDTKLDAKPKAPAPKPARQRQQ